MASKNDDVIDVESRDVTDLAEVMSFGDIEKALTDPFLDIDVDPLEAQQQIISRILNATDADEVFGGKTTVGARDMVGVPFTLVSARLQRGDFQESALNVFAIMECVDKEGVPFIMTCGAAQIIAQVFWAYTHDKLPMTLVVREKDKPTKNGYVPMWLEFPSKGKADF